MGYIQTALEKLKHLAEVMNTDTAYYSAEVKQNSAQIRPEYSAYFAYGDKINDSLLFGGFDADETLQQIDDFAKNKDADSLKKIYHQKQIESLRATLEFHESQLKDKE